jgi:hypothetical protein
MTVLEIFRDDAAPVGATGSLDRMPMRYCMGMTVLEQGSRRPTVTDAERSFPLTTVQNARHKTGKNPADRLGFGNIFAYLS